LPTPMKTGRNGPPTQGVQTSAMPQVQRGVAGTRPD
jgi:hypothetical protein